MYFFLFCPYILSRISIKCFFYFKHSALIGNQDLPGFCFLCLSPAFIGNERHIQSPGFFKRISTRLVLALDYSSTSIEYSSTPYWITPVLLLDYSSTSIGLLQYFYWITPVLLSESIKVLPHASPPNPFLHQLVNPFPRLLRIIYIIGSRRVSKLMRRLAILV